MMTKKIVSTLLLLFVVASVGTIVAKETGILGTSPTAPITETSKPPEATSPVKVVAYYFHGNSCCPTCRKLETQTTEAVETGFAEDIKKGRVEFKKVNMEEKGNEHYVQEYRLVACSVIVSRYEGGTQKSWKRLDDIWKLVGNHDAYIRYVQNETTAMLKEDH